MKRSQKQKLNKLLVSLALTLGALTVLPTLPGSNLLQTAPEATPTAIPTSTPTPYSKVEATPTAEPTARPTAKPVTDYVKLTEEQLARLEKELETETNDTVYDTEEDYFGTDMDFDEEDVFVVEMYATPVPTQVPTATPAPTPTPTPVPTPTPTPEPTPTPTVVPTATPAPDGALGENGEDPTTSTATPGPTAEPTPEPTPTPTAEPTPKPTPVPTATPAPTPQGPVLQYTNPSYQSHSQITIYNAWPNEYKQFAYAAAQAAGVSYEMVLAIIYNESRFQAGATHVNTNGTTDWGLMQINDVCFSFVSRAVPSIQTKEDLLDPYKNIQAGCALLAYHMRGTGYNEDMALLRYQVGEGAYATLLSQGITTTATHTRVLGYREIYRSAAY